MGENETQFHDEIARVVRQRDAEIEVGALYVIYARRRFPQRAAVFTDLDIVRHRSLFIDERPHTCTRAVCTPLSFARGQNVTLGPHSVCACGDWHVCARTGKAHLCTQATCAEMTSSMHGQLACTVTSRVFETELYHYTLGAKSGRCDSGDFNMLASMSDYTPTFTVLFARIGIEHIALRNIHIDMMRTAQLVLDASISYTKNPPMTRERQKHILTGNMRSRIEEARQIVHFLLMSPAAKRAAERGLAARRLHAMLRADVDIIESVSAAPASRPTAAPSFAEIFARYTAQVLPVLRRTLQRTSPEMLSHYVTACVQTWLYICESAYAMNQQKHRLSFKRHCFAVLDMMTEGYICRVRITEEDYREAMKTAKAPRLLQRYATYHRKKPVVLTAVFLAADEHLRDNMPPYADIQKAILHEGYEYDKTFAAKGRNALQACYTSYIRELRGALRASLAEAQCAEHVSNAVFTFRRKVEMMEFEAICPSVARDMYSSRTGGNAYEALGYEM